MSYGMTSMLGMAFQNSVGTAANVASATWFEFLSESIFFKRDALVAQGHRGIYDEGDDYGGRDKIDGDMSIEGKPIEMGMFLKAMFGAPTTVQSGGIYTHTFKPANTDFDTLYARHPFTIFRSLGVGSGDIFMNMNASTLELAVSEGEFLMAKLGVVGGKISATALGSPSYAAGTRFAWDVASLSMGGTALDRSTKLTFSFDNALEPKYTLANTRVPTRIKRTGFRKLSVAGTLKFESVSEKDDFVAQTLRNMTLNFTGPTQIQSGYYERLSIIVPTFEYMEFANPVGGPGEIEANFTGACRYLTTSGTALQITLVNTQTGY